jgi:asparagine synthase (glutamine-hydrolysing)
MCGFAGVLFCSVVRKQDYRPGLSAFRQAAAHLSHRGDTDHREVIGDSLWLSHYRLAFQDVAAGVQPMLSADGNHIIVFNGEVYNHLAFRTDITKHTGHQFRTRSDTETLLEGWKAFGTEFFDTLDGEFAFVICDISGNHLVAHRDPFGVKPLFFRVEAVNTRQFAEFNQSYTFSSTILEFSSEIKALASPKSWNRNGLLRQYVGLFEPICTPFDHVIQVPAGGVLCATNNGAGFQCTLNTFALPVRLSSKTQPPATETQFETAFSHSVKDRLLSDVELGVYLSGGVDSKAVAFELARHAKGKGPLKSLTIGFENTEYDETEEALRFSQYLGFEPHVIKVDGDALNYSYPLAVQASENIQPYTNGAAKWWLSLFTRQYVQGVLTGDGADELLCGYPSFRYANWWKQAMRLRGGADSPAEINTLLNEQPLGTHLRDTLFLRRFSSHSVDPWLAGSSAAGNGQDFIDSLNTLGVPHPLFGQIKTITESLLGPEEAQAWLGEQANSIQSWFSAGLESKRESLCNPELALLFWQNYFVKTHLPVQILNWVGDRMEMANTLEGRTPFLSRRMRTLILYQPDRCVVLGLKDKVILRRTYEKLISSKFATTPKKQFNAPFLNSSELMRKFQTETVFEETGIARNSALQAIKHHARLDTRTDEYTKAHILSSLQTAICLSIVHRTLIEDTVIPRCHDFEERFLKDRVQGACQT